MRPAIEMNNIGGAAVIYNNCCEAPAAPTLCVQRAGCGGCSSAARAAWARCTMSEQPALLYPHGGLTLPTPGYGVCSSSDSRRGTPLTCSCKYIGSLGQQHTSCHSPTKCPRAVLRQGARGEMCHKRVRRKLSIVSTRKTRGLWGHAWGAFPCFFQVRQQIKIIFRPRRNPVTSHSIIFDSRGGGGGNLQFKSTVPDFNLTVIELLTSFDGGCIHQGCWSWGGEGRRALQGLPGRGHGWQCKDEGQETRTMI